MGNEISIRAAQAEARVASLEASLAALQAEVALLRSPPPKPIPYVGAWGGLSWIAEGIVEPFIFEGKTYLRNSDNQLWQVLEQKVSTELANEIIIDREKHSPWWHYINGWLNDRWWLYKGKRYTRGHTGEPGKVKPEQLTSDVYEVKLGQWVGVLTLGEAGFYIDTTKPEPIFADSRPYNPGTEIDCTEPSKK